MSDLDVHVMGVDPSTVRPTIAEFRNGKFVGVQIIKLDKTESRYPRRLRLPKIMERFDEFMTDRLNEINSTQSVLIIGFEQPVIKVVTDSRRRSIRTTALSTLSLAEVVGMMKVILWQKGVEPDFIFDVSTTRAKRVLTGRGNAAKATVQEAAVDLVKLDNPEITKLTEDEADAVAVAFAVWQEVRPAIYRGELDLRKAIEEE